MRASGRVLGGAVMILAITMTALPAHAYVPDHTPRRDLEARARRSLADPAARPTTPGVVVLRGGRTIVGVNDEDPFVPASLMKLVTTTVAVARFGPDHRFPTRVLVAGELRAAPSALYLVGGGDPTLATDAYRRRRYLPKPTDAVQRPAFASGSPTIEQLAARVRAAGITVVRGDLVVDESLFDGARTQRGWLDSYIRRDPDTGLLSALTVNEGRLDLAGDVLAPSPAVAAGRFLRRSLAARGVVVTGDVVLGRSPTDAVEVARVVSPPLREIVDFVNRYSINFPAEILLKGLGARFGGAGSTAAGVAVVRETLTELGVPLDGFRMEDGSGLSVLNRVTPATLGALLHVMLTKQGASWDALRASVPVAGGPGTLLRRMTRAPVVGNLRGKTGQIREVRAMAGWVTARDGVPLVYVMVFNDAPRPFSLTAALDLFGTLLAAAR